MSDVIEIDRFSKATTSEAAVLAEQAARRGQPGTLACDLAADARDWLLISVRSGPQPAPAANPVRGFDADRDCGRLVDRMRAAGVGFVGRYYSHNAAKNLGVSEARMISAAGIDLVAIWEARADRLSSFTHRQGVDDATSAYNQATETGQPGATPIYFAVDLDVEPASLAASVGEYFQGVADGFAAIGRGNPAYRVGVYGSGLVCSFLSQRRLAARTWLAQSARWYGSDTYRDWNIRQHLEADPYGFGFTIDPDEAGPDHGGFRVS